MRVFTIPPHHLDKPDLDVEPRMFVHKVNRCGLVEVEDTEGMAMPWLLDDAEVANPCGQDLSRDLKKAKIFQCKVCRKWFDHPSALATHENAHSGNKRKLLRVLVDRLFTVMCSVQMSPRYL